MHLQHAGHPIVGDTKYGMFELNHALARGERLGGHKFERMFLHARRLKFIHPATGEEIELVSPLPPECEALLAVLTSSPRPPRGVLPHEGEQTSLGRPGASLKVTS